MTQENPGRDHDIVDKALHSFDHVLDVVHDRVLRPIILAGRALAFGFIIVLATIVLVCALVIGLTRFMNVYFFAGREWITYLVVGVLLVTTGLIVWRRRRPLQLRK